MGHCGNTVYLLHSITENFGYIVNIHNITKKRVSNESLFYEDFVVLQNVYFTCVIPTDNSGGRIFVLPRKYGKSFSVKVYLMVRTGTFRPRSKNDSIPLS